VIEAPARRKPGISQMSIRRARPSRLGQASVVTVLAAVTAAGPAAAETLQEAWQAALSTDPSLKAGEHRAAAAGAALESARGGRYPTVAVSGSTSRWETTPAFDFAAIGSTVQLPLFGGRSFSMSSANVSVPVYTGGRIGASIDAARAEASARDLDTDKLTEDVKLNVAEHYIGVLRAMDDVSVAESNTTSLTAHAQDVADMYRNGQVPRNDYLAANVSLADAEQKELQAGTALDIARAAYNRAVGREQDAPVMLDGELPSVDPRLSAPVEELIELAANTRTELAGLSATVDALAARARAARAESRPQLTVSGGYTYLENRVLNREDFWSVGLNVTWRLFDGGQSRNDADALTLRAAAASNDKTDLAGAIELEVRKAWLTVQQTRQRVELTEMAVTQADENLRVVRDRYRNGEGTNTEVLDAEALRSLSRSNYEHARHDAALAEFRLARAVGVL
jgi:outer membrane protein